MQPSGTLANSLCMLSAKRLSEAALSERRQSLGTQPWLDMLAMTLRPLALPHAHPHAFYKGLRLVGVDGTTFNVANTPPIKRSTAKTRARRGSEAFCRLRSVTLAELGTHHPLAARVGCNNESETALATDIVKVLTAHELLIGDRNYGYPSWVARLKALRQRPHFLLRVKQDLRARLVLRLADGSRIVTIKDPRSGQSFTLREIRASVRRPGKRWVRVRFWTDLLDHKHYPLHELVALYALRWEQELTYRELKNDLCDDNLLLSHTALTAVQEVCALIMAQAFIARARAQTATNHDLPMLQISFKKTLDACRNLGWLWALAGHIISAAQMRKIAIRVERALIAQATKRRRQRSCPRKVRQPIHRWPRLIKNTYAKGDFEYGIR